MRLKDCSRIQTVSPQIQTGVYLVCIWWCLLFISSLLLLCWHIGWLFLYQRGLEALQYFVAAGLVSCHLQPDDILRLFPPPCEKLRGEPAAEAVADVPVYDPTLSSQYVPHELTITSTEGSSPEPPRTRLICRVI